MALMVLALLLFESSNSNGIWVILAIILHEFGHIFTMSALKSKPQKILLGNFNVCIIDQKYYQRTFGQDLCILIAGPLANIIAACLAYLIYCKFQQQWLCGIFLSNIFLGIFNLLPVSCLDGGQIFLQFLLLKLSENKAKFIASTISFMILVLLLVLGIMSAFSEIMNFSLLFLSLYLLMVVFIKKDMH
jgi:stage IV sporulation protein FB